MQECSELVYIVGCNGKVYWYGIVVREERGEGYRLGLGYR